MEKNNARFEIISLGVNCLPRTVLTRNRIKPRKQDGELSCPFDLVSHPTKRVLYYLKNNFNNYFSDLFFEVRKRNIFDFRGKGLWQKKDGTKFFHDKDCKINDKKKLVKRITNRIKNFYNITSSDKPILFVISIFDDTDIIENLFQTLKDICHNKKIVLVVLAFDIPPQNFSKGIYSLNLAKPEKKYSRNWNTRKFVNSPLGQYTEKCICSFVNNIITKEFI